MNFSENALSELPALSEIDLLIAEMQTYRPLPKDIEERVLHKFRLNWNYHSNSIEGNPYNYGETVAFLMHGITAKGKTLKDHLDIQGHNDAINFLLAIVKEEREFTESDLRSLHKLLLVKEYETDAITPDGKPTKKTILLGDYKKQPNNVFTSTGLMHYYVLPEETPLQMQELMQWYQANAKEKKLHPVLFAALFHYRFVAIHPFDDGNGRIARLLMNLIFLRNNLPPVIIKTSDKNNYFAKLSEADAGNIQPFVEYIAGNLKTSIGIWLQGAKGENIDEQSDIDKEIALFKAGLKREIITDESKSLDGMKLVARNSISPLLNTLNEKLGQFNDLFEETYLRIIVNLKLNTGIVQGVETTIGNIENYAADYTEGLSFNYFYNTYKSSHTSNKVSVGLEITFDKYVYTVYWAGLDLKPIQKKYLEYISKEEINDIVKLSVNKVMEDIKKISQ